MFLTFDSGNSWNFKFPPLSSSLKYLISIHQTSDARTTYLVCNLLMHVCFMCKRKFIHLLLRKKSNDRKEKASRKRSLNESKWRIFSTFKRIIFHIKNFHFAHLLTCWRWIRKSIEGKGVFRARNTYIRKK